ncbi:hypothetical protein O1611_g2270 [Lasiodiplodia mahajangana]|uniref:Uncharacterized protein n=1 Tax=Lasiodiplodia mahajangana TaxID=1108764 RepID=A0ACC2JVC2_9PEZI|nr:hypothetical protein O1611_g2270 [Lasiodiplodia mahajangana]
MSTTSQNFNLGPLTTAYSASGPNCHSIFMTNGGVLLYGTNIESISWCQPPGFLPYEGYYYSPGICPADQTYACFANLNNGATAATCCPPGYQCKFGREPSEAVACQSTLLTGSAFSVSEYVATFGLSFATSTTSFYTAGNYVFARGAVVQRANTDPTWATNTGGSTMSNTNTQSSVSSTSMESRTSHSDTDLTTNSQSSSSTTSVGHGDGSSGNGLSNNAMIGIGVGASVGGLLILGAIVAAYYIGKRQRRLANQPTNQNNPPAMQEPQIYNGQPPWDNRGQYMAAVPLELEEQRRQIELRG